MTERLTVKLPVEATRDRFVRELVQRGAGTVGLEMNLAGFVDARRRFVLAIQGWENNLWMRPLLTRLEGYFEKTPGNEHTHIVFEKRGLTLPLFVLSWLLPYTMGRRFITEWPPPTGALVIVGIVVLLVLIAGGALFYIERRVHRWLIRGLEAVYDDPTLDDDATSQPEAGI